MNEHRGASHQPLSAQSPKKDTFLPEYSPVEDEGSHRLLSNWDEHILKLQRLTHIGRQGEQVNKET